MFSVRSECSDSECNELTECAKNKGVRKYSVFIRIFSWMLYLLHMLRTFFIASFSFALKNTQHEREKEELI
jgi:hypothetical protein